MGAGDKAVVATVVGSVESESGNRYEVRWDQMTREVYVFRERLVFVGMAVSVGEAVGKVRAWVRERGK